MKYIVNFQQGRQTNLGFTLIELMVGLTVGLMVIGTLSAVFVPSLSLYRNTQAISDIQESERYALNVLSQHISQAGYTGCDSRSPDEIINVTNIPQSTVAWATTLTQPVQIIPSTSDAAIYLGGVNGSDEDSKGNKRITDGDGGQTIGDVITIISADINSAPILDSHNPTTQELIFRGNQVNNLSSRFIILNDCNRSTLLRLGEAEPEDFDSESQTTVFSYASDDTDGINCIAEGTDGSSPGYSLPGWLISR